MKSFQLALLALIPQIFAVIAVEHRPNNHLLSKRSVTDILLNGGSPSTEEILRFNIIASDGVASNLGFNSDGPVAAGSLEGITFNVNDLGPTSDCPNADPSFADYGLIVKDGISSGQISVRGEVFLPNGTNPSMITQQISTCPVNNDGSTGLFHFDSVMNQTIDVSSAFSTYQPSLYLDGSGNLITIGDKTNGYDVITMNTCNDGNCPLYPGKMSDPSAFLFNESTWNGPVSGQWQSKLIVNVPIDSTQFSINTTNPSIGMRICSTIWNFYPSDNVGHYDSNVFQVTLENENLIGGFFLIPEGVLFSVGTSTAGTIVALQYTNLLGRVHNFKALDENCEFFNDCNALDDCTSVETTTSTTTTTSTATLGTLTTTETDTVTTTAVIIIPEQKGHKHSKHDGSYHNKDDDSEEEEDDDCEEE